MNKLRLGPLILPCLVLGIGIASLTYYIKNTHTTYSHNPSYVEYYTRVTRGWPVKVYYKETCGPVGGLLIACLTKQEQNCTYYQIDCPKNNYRDFAIDFGFWSVVSLVIVSLGIYLRKVRK